MVKMKHVKIWLIIILSLLLIVQLKQKDKSEIEQPILKENNLRIKEELSPLLALDDLDDIYYEKSEDMETLTFTLKRENRKLMSYFNEVYGFTVHGDINGGVKVAGSRMLR